MNVLKCPDCNNVPEVLYCCGEHFINCDCKKSPPCFHASKQQTVLEWNSYVTARTKKANSVQLTKVRQQLYNLVIDGDEILHEAHYSMCLRVIIEGLRGERKQ